MSDTGTGHTVICTFRVKADREAEFRDLLRIHWPTLRRLDLVEDDPPQDFVARHATGPVYVHVFRWKPGAVATAHEHPEVAAIWEPMGEMVEPRDGRPGMEFPHFERLDLGEA